MTMDSEAKLQQQLKQVYAAYATLKDRLKERNHQLTEALTQRENLSGTCADQADWIAELEQRLTRTQRQLENLAGTCTDQAACIEELEGQIQQLHVQNAHAEDKLRQIDTQKSQINALSEQLAASQAKTDKLEQTLKTHSEAFRDKETSWQSQIQDKEGRIQQLSEQIKQHSEQFKTAAQQQQQLERDKTNLQTALAKRNADVQEVQKALKDVQAEFTAERQQKREHEQTIESLTAKLTQTESQVSQLTEQVHNKSSDLDSAQKTIATLQEQTNGLGTVQREMEALKTQYQAAEDQNQEHMHTISSLTDEVDQANLQVSSLMSQIETLTQALETSQKTIQSQRTEIEDLHSSHEDGSQGRGNVPKCVGQAQELISNLRKELADSLEEQAAGDFSEADQDSNSISGRRKALQKKLAMFGGES